VLPVLCKTVESSARRMAALWTIKKNGRMGLLKAVPAP
jgi:hypothetical protein